MINFDEELKNFTKSVDVDQVRETVTEHDIKDLTDVVLGLMEQNKQLSLRIPQQQVAMPTMPMVDPSQFMQ